MLKVAVIFGGRSVEHEVSIISAVQAMSKMDKNKYEILPIYVTKDLEFRYGYPLRTIEIYRDMDLLKRNTKEVNLIKKNGKVYIATNLLFRKLISEVDVFFPVGHGTTLEDGSLQGMLSLMDLPIVGPKTLSASIGQDKVIQKLLYEKEGIKTPEFTWFYEKEYEDNSKDVITKCEKLKYPLIIKPASLGSSIGISTASNKNELVKGIEDALTYDSKIVVEKKLENFKEVNISVMGMPFDTKLSPIEEVKGKDKILSFNDKYIGGSKKSKGMVNASRIIPANISDKEKEKIEKYALQIFNLLGLEGVSRIDFLISKEGEVYANEVNTIPGSLSFYLWKEINVSYPEEIDELISLAIKSYKSNKTKVRAFDSNILAGYSGVKGSKGVK